VGALDAQLDPQKGLAGELPQQFEDLVRKTIGASAEGQADDTGIRQRFAVQRLEPAEIGMGRRVVGKERDELFDLVPPANVGGARLELVRQRHAPSVAQRLAARGVAKDAASGSLAAVTVGAGETATESDAVDLLPEGLP
jgi:hypothetical protein